MDNKIQKITNKFDNKENSMAEIIKQITPEKRVSKLIELGILSELEGYTWGSLGGDRFYVFANVKRVPVPMYKTSAHTGGKRADLNFFAFFGLQNNGEEKPWLIKGKNTNNFYGIQELEEKSRILTEAFNFDTDRKQKIQNGKISDNSISSPKSVLDKLDSYKEIDGFVPEGKEIQDFEKLNELLFRKFGMDFDYINKQPRTSGCEVEAVKILKLLRQ